MSVCAEYCTIRHSMISLSQLEQSRLHVEQHNDIIQLATLLLTSVAITPDSKHSPLIVLPTVLYHWAGHH